MEKRVIPFNEFGRAIHIFCADHCISKAELATRAGVNYATLLKVCKGLTAGHEIVPKVEEAMQKIARGEVAV